MPKKKKKKNNKKLTGMMGILFMVAMGMSGYKIWESGKFDDGIKVIGVLDGDTITVEGKTRFRLRNIDAPEMNFCGGKEAKDALTKLIGKNRVRIEEEIIDKWGRPMGLVYSGEVLINEEMLKSGWAEYHADKTTVADKLKAISDDNKVNSRGIFGKCWQMENTKKPECNIKGNIDSSNSSLKRYYYPGCVQYKTTIVQLDRGEEWFCSEAEAKKAGYVKSERCP